jgi:hypothetical protein
MRTVITVLLIMLLLPALGAQTSEYTASDPIVLRGAHDRVIRGKLIAQSGSEPAIKLVDCYNIIIEDNILYNSGNVGLVVGLGKNERLGIYITGNCHNITIRNNYLHDFSTGVYAIGATGNIKVDSNEMKNMHGPYPRGAFVQFNNCSGEGNSISFNKCENFPGLSNPEDAIKLYKSNGTPDSYIKVYHNRIRGGGPSTHGGGILLGDNGGSYQDAQYNVLVNPGHYGMGVGGGSNLIIKNNDIFSKKTDVSSAGIVAHDFYGFGCSLITIANNRVRWHFMHGGENPYWMPGDCGTVNGMIKNEWHAQVDESLLPDTILGKKDKIKFSKKEKHKHKRFNHSG